MIPALSSRDLPLGLDGELLRGLDLLGARAPGDAHGGGDEALGEHVGVLRIGGSLLASVSRLNFIGCCKL